MSGGTFAGFHFGETKGLLFVFKGGLEVVNTVRASCCGLCLVIGSGGVLLTLV